MNEGEDCHDLPVMPESTLPEAILQTASSFSTLIPVVGSPIASFLAQQAGSLMERRIQEGFETVSDKLKSVPKELLSSEEFASATITIFRSLQFEHSKEKRRYFSNIYNRFITETIYGKLEIEAFSLFSSITSNLSPESFTLLLLLPNGSEEFDETIGQRLEEKHSGLSLPYARRSLIELERENLIWEQPFELTMETGGPRLVHKKVLITYYSPPILRVCRAWAEF